MALEEVARENAIHFNRFRLRLTTLILLSFIPALALAIFTGVEQRRAESNGVRERAVLAAKLAATKQEYFLEESLRILEPLAALPLIHTTNFLFWNLNFQNLQKLQPRYVNFGLLGSDGRVVSSALPFDGAMDYSEHLFFRNAKRTEKFSVGELRSDFLTNTPTITFGYPIFDEDKRFSRVLFATASIESFQKLGEESEIPEQAVLHILDREGRVLCRFPLTREDSQSDSTPQRIQLSSNPTQSSAEFRDHDGVRRLYAFAPIRARGDVPFVAAVNVPTNLVFAKANRTLIRNLMLLLLVAVVALATAQWYACRRVLAPLTKLAKAAQKLAAGDFSARVTLKEDTEFHQLAETFNEMADKMHAAISKLENANTELTNAEAKFRHLVEQSLAGIYIIQDGRLVYVNPKMAEIFDYSAEELSSRPLLDFIAPEDRAKVSENVRRRESGEVHSVQYELRILRRDGRAIDVEVHGARSVYNGRTAVLGMLLDITERKRAQAELARERTMLRTLIDLLPDVIYVKDRESRFVLANSACARVLKAPSLQDVIGKSDADFHPPERAERWRVEELKVLNGEAVVEKDDTLIRPDGSEGYFLTTKIPLRDSEGNIVGLVGSGRDITERKSAAEAIRKLNADLVQRVEERTAELKAANEELANSSKLKDEFLANMSHELRTPLNAILGLSESLLEQVSGTLTPRQIKAITTISTSGAHLLSLINDILDLSKIEAGKMELHSANIDVDDFCNSCLSFVKSQAMQKRIAVSFENKDGVKSIDADPKRLKQILVNLLTNAVKFTPEGGSVGLSVILPKDENIVQFSVSDTGIGIAPADASKLFRAFTQIDSGLNRAQEGTGLGLALVARLAELHGGSVSLSSELGKGSCFTVTLPRVASPGVVPKPSPVLDRSGYKRALLIEDDPTSGEQIVRYLAELGVTTVVHARGDESVDVALKEQPDFILLDLLLPGESGWVVLARLKEHPGTKHIPVVIVTVLDEPEKSRAYGAAAHLTKPVTRKQLAQFLQRSAVQKPTPPPASSLSATASSKPVILLAEDNPANIQTIGDYLQERGYDMHYAPNGQVAVNLAREVRPDCILMDIQMPVMDGLTAIREIRSEHQIKDIPIVALTALAMPGDRENCISAGATDYLSKPVSLKALATLISNLLPSQKRPKPPLE